MYRPRNEQCPQRGVGLTHTVNHGPQCIHCGALTIVVSPVSVAELREMVIAEAEPTVRQRRWWEFLYWSYRRKVAVEERTNVPPLGPADAAWLDDALAVMDGD